MRAEIRVLLSMVASACIIACGESDGEANEGEDNERCLSGIAIGIYGGQAAPGDVGLLARQAWAVGALESEYGTLYCTGVLIDPQWVLTAAHCAGEGLRFRLAAEKAPLLTVVLGEVIADFESDLALIEVTTPQKLKAAGVLPLALRQAPLSVDDSPSMTAVLAGVGLTEQGDSGALLLVEEPVVKIDDASVTVDGSGLSGACGGDSGGPLLAHTDSGSLEVLGILSKGATNCRGMDVYTRVDVHAGWIQEIKRVFSPSSDPYCAKP